MTRLYEGHTADQAWRAAASEFSAGSASRAQSGRGGATLELLHAVFAISDPRQRWVVSRRPAISPAFAVAEVFWILNGRSDAAFINHWNPRLPLYAGDVEHYHAAYGSRLRRGFGFDQLERAYQALRNNADTRQVVLQIWDPGIDFPDEDGRPVSPDVPCNICALPKVRGGRLEWLQVMRSNDLQRGLPYNLVQFTCLQEVMSGWLGVEVGSYSHVSDSLHVYEKDAADLQLVASMEEMPNTDSLALAKDESDRVIAEMGRLLDDMTAADLSEKGLRAMTTPSALPKPYLNMLLIAAADSARRRGWAETSNELLAGCDNPALLQAWNNWAERHAR